MRASGHSAPRRGRLGGSILLATILVGAPFQAAPAVAAEPADAVVQWNGYAIEALVNAVDAPVAGAGNTPPVAALHLAMVQGAVYDAVNSIDRSHRPYLLRLPSAPASASQAAAAATAAHHVLIGLVPTLAEGVEAKLNERYDDTLSGIPAGPAKAAGIAAGAAAGQAMLDARAHDGRYVAHSFTPGSAPGVWRPDLPGMVTDPFAWIGRVDPFMLISPSQFRIAPPHPLTSKAYAREYNEVKALGAATGSSRTDEQTAIGQFHATNPLIMFNATLRAVAGDEDLTIAEAARLFAMTSMSAADSAIACWDNKEYWNFWRPVTAIREAANDGNPATAPQEGWLPWAPTPPYPDHPSGYNCFAGGFLHAADAFFGGHRVRFTLTSPATGTSMSFRRFPAVLRDSIDARVYVGLHFRQADVEAAWLGKKVAHWMNQHYFQAVD